MTDAAEYQILLKQVLAPVGQHAWRLVAGRIQDDAQVARLEYEVNVPDGLPSCRGRVGFSVSPLWQLVYGWTPCHRTDLVALQNSCDRRDTWQESHQQR